MAQEQTTQLSVRDDLPHRPGASPSWRESVYFEFVDDDAGVWAYQYIGERPNRDRAGLAMGVVLGAGGRTGTDLRVAGRLEHDRVDRDEASHRCAGLELTTVEPMRHHRIAYEGPVVGPSVVAASGRRLDPAAMRPGAARTHASASARLDLAWEATTPFHTFPTDLLTPWFAGHLQQMGRCRGRLTVGEMTVDVDGPAFRDRSWGERDWFGIDRYVFVYAPFPDASVAATATRHGGADEVRGWVSGGAGGLAHVAGWDEEVSEEPGRGKPLPRELRLEIADDAGGRHRFEAEILAAVPSVFEGRGDRAGQLAWVDRCLARFHRDGRSALGVVESQQVVPRPDGWA